MPQSEGLEETGTGGPGAVWEEVVYLAKGIAKVFLSFFPAFVVLLAAWHFPYDTDPNPGDQRKEETRRPTSFYEAAYERNDGRRRGLDYEETAREMAALFDIEGQIRRFATQYELSGKRVLEVGSGRGYLQDIVPDYTGLDLSPTVAGRYHKPFVAASATAMPFADNAFDAIWTVWVLEHIPEPERALREMRRVLKPGGMLFLMVAWNCTPWAAGGFNVRPYSDFNWRGKAVKASLAIRGSRWFLPLRLLPVRAVRWTHYRISGRGARLRYSRLEPNYEIYWEPDSDAAVSLDAYETYLWFRAMGDECLNCPGGGEQYLDVAGGPLILRIRK